jgi:rhodanese-related sulfurtransferase
MPTSIDRQRVEQLISQGALVVEVLPAEEYLDEHLPGAISIPLKELDRDRVRELDPARPVVVYCYDGT